MTLSGCSWWAAPAPPPNDVDAARLTAVLADPLIAPRVAADRVLIRPATTDTLSTDADFFRATVSTSYRDPDYMDADPDEIPPPTPREFFDQLRATGWRIVYIDCDAGVMNLDEKPDYRYVLTVDATKDFTTTPGGTFTAVLSGDPDGVEVWVPYHLDAPDIFDVPTQTVTPDGSCVDGGPPEPVGQPVDVSPFGSLGVEE